MRDLLNKALGYLIKAGIAAYELVVNFHYSSSAMLGAGSRLYRQTSVINLQNDKTKIRVGKNAHVRGELLIFPYGGEIEIGESSYIGEGTRLWSGDRITIGKHVGISHNVNIIDWAHKSDHLERAAEFDRLFTVGHPKQKGDIVTAPIVIGDHVAIYPNSSIARGVRIGEGAIIAACCVVLSDVPPFTLMLGNPARPMKNLNPASS